MKKFLLVNYSPTDKNESHMDVPYLWMTLNSFFKRNSIDPDAWQWLDPIFSPYATNPQELVDEIVSQEPDVLGISCYIWNNSLTLWVAEQVKLKLPEVKIIAGGPSLTYWKRQDWFKKYWFIDLVCTYTGYGEIFITDYLDGKKPKEIAYAVYPDLGRHVWNESNVSIQPKAFAWPMPYQDNIEYLKRFKQEHKSVKVIIDTSRGCPYGCTFCEWGGGTSTKVTFKPLESVISELELMFDILQPLYVDVNNANFGIVKEDLTIAEKICELHQKHKCVRDVNLYGPTKTNKQRLKEIMELFAANGMVNEMKLSIQSTDSTILQNIKRIDMNFEQQRELFLPVAQKYNIPMKFEVIMGLPGETLDTFYKTISDLVDEHSLPMIHEWILLDSSPADREPYYTDMGIKTKHVMFQKDAYVSHTKPKTKSVVETGYRNILQDDTYANLEPPRYVVGTFSYSQEDWIEMKLSKHLIFFLYRARLLHGFVSIAKENGVRLDEFFKCLFREFLVNTPVVSKAKQVITDSLNSEDVFDTFYIDLAENLPYFSYFSILKFAILVNPKQFFNDLGTWASSKYGDTRFIEVGDKIGSKIYTPMYDETLSHREKISTIISMCKVTDDSMV